MNVKPKIDLAGPAHDQDYYGWAMHQADLIEAGRVDELDREWLADEVRDLARNEYHKLETVCRVLLMHMLKWDRQPEGRSRSWVLSMSVQRIEALQQITDSRASAHASPRQSLARPPRQGARRRPRPVYH